MDPKESGREYGRWMELAQDRVQWRALVLAMLKHRVLLPEIWFNVKCVDAGLRFKSRYKMSEARDKYIEYSGEGLLNFYATKFMKDQ
jgi:hypothetical protein